MQRIDAAAERERVIRLIAEAESIYLAGTRVDEGNAYSQKIVQAAHFLLGSGYSRVEIACMLLGDDGAPGLYARRNPRRDRQFQAERFKDPTLRRTIETAIQVAHASFLQGEEYQYRGKTPVVGHVMSTVTDMFRAGIKLEEAKTMVFGGERTEKVLEKLVGKVGRDPTSPSSGGHNST